VANHQHNKKKTMNNIVLSVIFVMMATLFSIGAASAQDNKDLVVRVARIQIDTAQLENYRVALKEGAETAVRLEPGVLALYAVYEKNNPTHVTVFEVYANAAAYKTHLETTHFKKYKRTTKDMVKSLELVDVNPIALASKPKLD
jgi:quinol monooxygenase YgiN